MLTHTGCLASTAIVNSNLSSSSVFCGLCYPKSLMSEIFVFSFGEKDRSHFMFYYSTLLYLFYLIIDFSLCLIYKLNFTTGIYAYIKKVHRETKAIHSFLCLLTIWKHISPLEGEIAGGFLASQPCKVLTI